MSYINILLWGNEYNKSNKITSDTLWEACISCIQFLYSSENNLLSNNFPYCQSAVMTATATWNPFVFLVSWSGCSSTPVSLPRLLDLCKEKEERKTDKNFVNLKIPLKIMEVMQNIRQGLEGAGFT